MAAAWCRPTDVCTFSLEVTVSDREASVLSGGQVLERDISDDKDEVTAMRDLEKAMRPRVCHERSVCVHVTHVPVSMPDALPSYNQASPLLSSLCVGALQVTWRYAMVTPVPAKCVSLVAGRFKRYVDPSSPLFTHYYLGDDTDDTMDGKARNW